MGNSQKRPRDDDDGDGASGSAKRSRTDSHGHWDSIASKLAKSAEGRCLFIMRGPRGCGKTSLAQAILAAKLGVPRASVESPSVYRAFIVGIDDYFYSAENEYYFDAKALPHYLQKVEERLEAQMRAGVSPLFMDNVNARLHELQSGVALADKNNYSIVVVGPDLMGPDALNKDVLLQRCALREEGCPGRRVSRHYIEKIVANFDSLPDGPGALDSVRRCIASDGFTKWSDRKGSKGSQKGRGNRAPRNEEYDGLDVPQKLQKQIGHYFSDDNLVSDSYLLSLMSEDGWVPLDRIATFPRVRNITQDMSVVAEALSASTALELDEAQQKIRRKGDWADHLPHRAEVKVDSSSVGRIIGKGGINIKNLRSQSGAFVSIREPEEGQSEATVVITGSSLSVEKAISSLQQLLDRAQARPRPTEESAPAASAAPEAEEGATPDGAPSQVPASQEGAPTASSPAKHIVFSDAEDVPGPKATAPHHDMPAGHHGPATASVAASAAVASGGAAPQVVPLEQRNGGQVGEMLDDFDGSTIYGGDYLSFKRGDRIELIPHNDAGGGWSYGQFCNDSRKGWFPTDFWAQAD